MVFPQMQIDMFPRLQRFDVDFDVPDAFLPEFPPAIFLQNRPELGDVSRGEVVSINNFVELFGTLVTPVQLDGLRMLVTPFPQEEFNATADRKSAEPSLGVADLNQDSANVVTAVDDAFSTGARVWFLGSREGDRRLDARARVAAGHRTAARAPYNADAVPMGSPRTGG
jgi:hypothetical protein